MKATADKLKYPIGQFEYGKKYTIEQTRQHIKYLSKFPKELKKTLKKLKNGEFEKKYRPGGWSVRQVVHHLADSHMNAYIRLKMAVTENLPTIKPYEEQLWAETEDGKHGPLKYSLKLLELLHKRMIMFLESISEEDLAKAYYHPGNKKTLKVQEVIALYVWHSQHHLGHIKIVANKHKQFDKPKDSHKNTKAKPGPKPKTATDTTGTVKAKPGPKPKVAADTTGTVKAKPGPKPKTAADTTGTVKAKPGPKPKVAAGTTGTVKAKPGPKPKTTAKSSATKKSGMSLEHMEKMRAARQAKMAERNKEPNNE